MKIIHQTNCTKFERNAHLLAPGEEAHCNCNPRIELGPDERVPTPEKILEIIARVRDHK